MVELPHSDSAVFARIPPSLDARYLESVFSRSTGKERRITDCTVTNLCAGQWGGVSNSGATVIRFDITFAGGGNVALVAKILSPDAVNLFKIDTEFDSRREEVQWAQWWGEQNVSFAGRVYDTRFRQESRDFWILQECFPSVGWDDIPMSGMKDFVAEAERLQLLFDHAAELHGYSQSHIVDLKSRLPPPVPDETLTILRSVLDDSEFQTLVGLNADKCKILETECIVAEQRPSWVDEWDIVCVSNDLAPDNFGLRPGEPNQLVTFDWSAAHLGPMELDIDLLLRRIGRADAATRTDLLKRYSSSYADATGREVDGDLFRARMPWARFLFHHRMIADHVHALRWIPHQTRSREFIRMFIGLCGKMLEELPLHATADSRA